MTIFVSSKRDPAVQASSGPQASVSVSSGPPGPPGTTDWNGITNKPATFPPSAHVHPDVNSTDAGFMAVSDKAKLDGVAPAATANASRSNLMRVLPAP